MVDHDFRIEAFADRAHLYHETAALILEQLAEHVGAKGRAVFVAAGGSTPGPVYERLAQMPARWEAVDVTLTDERWLAPTDERSNELMLRNTLLQHEAARARFSPLWSDAVDAEHGVETAHSRLSKLVPFSVVLLGMGSDGHVASLFPGSPVLEQGLDAQSPKLCIAAPPADPAPDTWRISLTLRALETASLIVLLITGDEKRRRLEARSAESLPVHALLERGRHNLRVLWSP